MRIGFFVGTVISLAQPALLQPVATRQEPTLIGELYRDEN